MSRRHEVLVEAAPLHSGGEWAPVVDDEEAFQVLRAQAVTRAPVETMSDGWWLVEVLPHVRSILTVEGRFFRETATHAITIIAKET